MIYKTGQRLRAVQNREMYCKIVRVRKAEFVNDMEIRICYETWDRRELRNFTSNFMDEYWELVESDENKSR